MAILGPSALASIGSRAASTPLALPSESSSESEAAGAVVLGFDHVDAVAARAEGDREKKSPAMQRERSRDCGAERVGRERAKHAVGVGMWHAGVALVDYKHQRVLACSAVHGQSELELGQHAWEVEVDVALTERDVLVAERERVLVGLPGGSLMPASKCLCVLIFEVGGFFTAINRLVRDAHQAASCS